MLSRMGCPRNHVIGVALINHHGAVVGGIKHIIVGNIEGGSLVFSESRSDPYLFETSSVWITGLKKLTFVVRLRMKLRIPNETKAFPLPASVVLI